MTRRVLAYRIKGGFYITNEFIGDKNENPAIDVTWDNVIALYNSEPDTIKSFEAIAALVGFYYHRQEGVQIYVTNEIPPDAEEVWLFEDGQLLLYAKYGEVVTECAKKHCNGENIRKAEQVLIDNGIDPDEVQTVLQAVGYALCDTELYPEKESDDAIDYFGNVRWCDDDLVGKLMEMGIQPTKERVSEIRYELENGHHFTDHQIEAGWDVIEAAINDKHYPEDLEEDEE